MTFTTLITLSLRVHTYCMTTSLKYYDICAHIFHDIINGIMEQLCHEPDDLLVAIIFFRVEMWSIVPLEYSL